VHKKQDMDVSWQGDQQGGGRHGIALLLGARELVAVDGVGWVVLIDLDEQPTSRGG